METTFSMKCDFVRGDEWNRNAGQYSDGEREREREMTDNLMKDFLANLNSGICN